MAKLPTITEPKLQKHKPVVAKETPVTAGFKMTGPYWRRVELKIPAELRPKLMATLRRLEDEGATLKNGTEVCDKTKMLQWILENFEAAETSG